MLRNCKDVSCLNAADPKPSSETFSTHFLCFFFRIALGSQNMIEDLHKSSENTIIFDCTS